MRAAQVRRSSSVSSIVSSSFCFRANASRTLPPAETSTSRYGPTAPDPNSASAKPTSCSLVSSASSSCTSMLPARCSAVLISASAAWRFAATAFRFFRRPTSVVATAATRIAPSTRRRTRPKSMPEEFPDDGVAPVPDSVPVPVRAWDSMPCAAATAAPDQSLSCSSGRIPFCRSWSRADSDSCAGAPKETCRPSTATARSASESPKPLAEFVARPQAA
ncbi:hypothetical protein CMMCAS05_13860 [Clavibacter michiganensis subsp. michiganensis]|nr:hypothetical protein CMMCAS05_13860 [Clavibacter michiganensis subsp. michiganensis]